MIALAARNEMRPLRLAAFDEILPRDLDAGLDRFRSAADIIDIGKPARLVTDQQLGELFGGLGREEAGMGIGEFRGLFLHRGKYARVLMAEAGDRSAAG